jgi:hypothetical protein
MNMKKTFVVLTALAILPLAAPAQDIEADMVGEVVEVTTTIEAIDAENRLITLEDDAGDLVTIYAGPEVKRFDELKVGNQVTFDYYESVLVEVRKPEEGDAPSVTLEAEAVRGEGERPSGAVAEKVTAMVTIKAIDRDVPSVTVLAVDGGTRSFEVDPGHLEGVEVGDEVVVTYTQALMISVK